MESMRKETKSVVLGVEPWVSCVHARSRAYSLLAYQVAWDMLWGHARPHSHSTSWESLIQFYQQPQAQSLSPAHSSRGT